MLNLYIARHGNTFDNGDTLLRVGLRTDLPLSESGQMQARAMGDYLNQHHPNVSIVYTSELIRTQQTAKIACSALSQEPKFYISGVLNEIDYGDDDGKPESEVVKRLGEEALSLWDSEAKVPDGWHFNREEAIQSIKHFAKNLIAHQPNQNILLVTSNGIARFFPQLLDNADNFNKEHKLKLKTGALSHFTYSNGQWLCQYWGVRP